MKKLRKDHKAELWRFLQENPSWHTSKELAVIIGVSDRSIKRYAKDLADATAISVSSKGYRANQAAGADVSTSQDNDSDYTSIKRAILNDFTKASKQNIYDIADKFFLSESTAVKLLEELKEYVAPFLSLKRNGDEWTLIGSEINKRRIISDLLYRESAQSMIDTDSIQESFTDTHVAEIKQIIEKEALVKNVYLNQFDFNNVLLHVVIAVHRVKNGFMTRNSSASQSEVVQSASIKTSDTFGRDLISKVEDHEHLAFSPAPRHSLLNYTWQSQLHGIRWSQYG